MFFGLDWVGLIVKGLLVKGLIVKGLIVKGLNLILCLFFMGLKTGLVYKIQCCVCFLVLDKAYKAIFHNCP